MDTTDPSSQSSRWKLGGLNRYAVILAVAHLILACLIVAFTMLGGAKAGETNHWLVPALLLVLGPFMAFGVFSGLFRLVSGRWSLSPNLAFCLCLGGTWLVGVTRMCQNAVIRSAQAEQTQQELGSQAKALREGLQASVEKTGRYRLDEKRLAQYLRTAEAAGLPRPAVEECCRTTVALLNQERQKRVARRDAITSLDKAGGRQAKTVGSRRDAQDRLRLARRVLQASEGLQTHMTLGGKRVCKALVQKGVSEPQQRQLGGSLLAYEPSAKDRDACAAMIEYDRTLAAYFSLLADKWGKWRWDDKGFASSDPAIEKEYGRLSAQLAKLTPSADLPPKTAPAARPVAKSQDVRPAKKAQNIRPAKKAAAPAPTRKR